MASGFFSCPQAGFGLDTVDRRLTVTNLQDLGAGSPRAGQYDWT